MGDLYQNIRQWFRYYFVRKKAPLSWILWGDILRRQSSWQGSYAVSLAAVDEPDVSISLSRGAPGDNKIEITIYDGDNKAFDTVEINLSYRTMQKVAAGFNRAFTISRQKIKEENES